MPLVEEMLSRVLLSALFYSRRTVMKSKQIGGEIDSIHKVHTLWIARCAAITVQKPL